MKVRKSITSQLTLLFAAASTAVLLILGWSIKVSVEGHFEEQDMELLTGKLELTKHALEKVRAPRDLDSIPQQLDDSLIGHHGLAVVVIAPDGQTLFASRGAEFPKVLIEGRSTPGQTGSIVWKTKDHQPFRGISAAVPTGIAGTAPALVAVATDISHHQHFITAFQVQLWSGVILAALSTGLLAWWAARRGLAPLRAIKQEAEAITANRLDRRLAVENVPLELAELAETLNAMLTRLEDSFKRLSEFSSDIAHELRTPVSSLLTQTQVSLSKARTVEEYQEILASNAEEFERLSRIIADMLFLAKSDNHLIVPNLERVDLAAEVSGVLEFYEALADEKHIVLTCTGDAACSGDHLMLRRAINNLISNAIRHTPEGGTVSVRIESTADRHVIVAVENTGETIPAEHLSRLFDRFYRVDASRQRCSEGAGLGLAITQSIVRAHGGSVAVTSDDGRTRFCLVLPVLRSASDLIAKQLSDRPILTSRES